MGFTVLILNATETSRTKSIYQVRNWQRREEMQTWIWPQIPVSLHSGQPDRGAVTAARRPHARLTDAVQGQHGHLETAFQAEPPPATPREAPPSAVCPLYWAPQAVVGVPLTTQRPACQAELSFLTGVARPMSQTCSPRDRSICHLPPRSHPHSLGRSHRRAQRGGLLGTAGADTDSKRLCT